MQDSDKSFINQSKEVVINIFNKSSDFIDDTHYKLQNLYNINYNIAVERLKNDNFFKANFRLFLMELLWPKNLYIKYLHAICYICMNKNNKAIKKLNKILNIDTNYQPAKELLEKFNNIEELYDLVLSCVNNLQKIDVEPFLNDKKDMKDDNVEQK